MTCPHNVVTATYKRGPYCCQCNRPLVSLFLPIERDTPAGALLWEKLRPAGQSKRAQETSNDQ